MTDHDTDDDRTESPSTSRRTFLTATATLAAGTTGVGAVSTGAARDAAATQTASQYFRVRIENVSTPNTLDTPEGSIAVPLSPGAYAVHDSTVSLFTPGDAASPGLEAVAEDGMPGTLAGELRGVEGVREAGAFAGDQTATDPNQPDGGPEPPIFPGGAYEFSVKASPGDRLSLASMFIQSNDLFYAPGPAGIELFADGDPVEGDVTNQIDLWDAGTEADQQPGVGGDQAPRQSGLDTGAPDDDTSTVQRISDANSEGYDYPATEEVIRVTVEPIQPTPFVVTIENVSTPETLDTPDGSVAVPLSPGAYAVHDPSVGLFASGEAASPGLEAVAEDGMPGTLAGEAGSLDGVSFAGSFTGDQTDTDPNQPANGPQPPIFPGGSYSFAVPGLPGDRLSFATMFIQSNDLFYAPDPAGIPLFENGQPVARDVTDQIDLWDAGTEVDQQPGVGGDQAPRQSGLDTGSEDDDTSTVQRVSDANSEGYDYPATDEVVRVTVHPVSLIGGFPGASGRPGNLDDDALLEDIDGDGEGQIADVISYFNNRESAIVQNNPERFDFDGNGSAGNIGDVIELFNKLFR